MHSTATALKLSVCVVATLLITYYLPRWTIFAAFAGAGNLPGWLIFPYYVISLCFVNTPNPPTFCLTYVQCIVYGGFLTQAWAKRELPRAAFLLAAIHAVAVLAAALVWPRTGLAPL